VFACAWHPGCDACAFDVTDYAFGLQTRPPGSTLEVQKQFQIFPDDDNVKDLNYKAILRWTPQLEHAGLPPWTTGGEYTILISSTAIDCRSFSHSVVFRVHKCEYCVSDRDSMHSIADRFSTHWTQMWSSNHEIEVPDQLAKGQRIKLGNFYKTVKGDTWKLIAVRFGTTVERLLEINPELASESGGLVAADDMVAMITPDSAVCVMPDTCPQRRTPHPGVTW